MSCRGCGEKANRHAQGVSVFGDLDQRKEHPPGVTDAVSQASYVGKGFQASEAAPSPEDPLPPAMDPMAAIMAAQKMTYEQLTERRQFQQRMIKRQSDALMEEMTEAMKRVHVDELISVANADKLSLPGMTPAQAVVALKEALERPDFAFIESHYPGLTEAVNKRYSRLMEERLPGPQNQ